MRGAFGGDGPGQPMDITPFATLPDVLLLTPERRGDSRGFLSETYSRRALSAAGIDVDFVQENHTLSTARHTLRGLHFQIPPFAQAKLVRVTRGAVLDVAVDIRRGSPTHGRHVSVVISADAWNQIYLPVGFAHGFLTLSPDTEVVYKVGAYYSPAHDRGLAFDDPDLAIAWKVPPDDLVLSDKDRRNPKLADLPPAFVYAPPKVAARYGRGT